MKRILLITNDVVGSTMAGPGIRYVEMARELGRRHRVTLAAPEPSTAIEGISTIIYRYGRTGDLLEAAAAADAVIAQSLHPRLLDAVRQNDTRYIADLYDPFVLENLEAQRVLPLARQQTEHAFFHTVMTLQLAAADHILCASDRQRDYWLGTLTALGRLTPELYRADPTLSSLISLLPFGYRDQTPKATDKGALKSHVSNLNPKKDRLFIWGGGVWNWFDPLTLIKAVAAIGQQRQDIKLLFLGTRHPNPNTPEMKMLNRAHQLAERLKVKERLVFFNEGWVAYDQLANYLLPAAGGVSTHFDHAETRFSFRTRLLSYIWAGLPIIATRGDSMSDLVEQRDLGLTVDYQDQKGWVKALTTVADDTAARQKMKASLKKIWPEFTWPRLVAPLSQRLDADDFTNQIIGYAQLKKLQSRYLLTGFKKVWQNKGAGGVVKKLVGR